MAISDQPFKIDGVAIPTPTTYKYVLEDLSSEATGRTLDGVMHKDVIDEKDTYECEWKSLSWQDTATLLNAVKKKTKVAFTYADPYTPNEFVTHDFYVGKRGMAALNLKDSKKTWDSITMTFIRV